VIARAVAFGLRVTAGVLAVAADHFDAPALTGDPILDPEPAGVELGECELELPWPERRQSCVNYPYESYFS
jgi:hypothetical protein